MAPEQFYILHGRSNVCPGPSVCPWTNIESKNTKKVVHFADLPSAYSQISLLAHGLYIGVLRDDGQKIYNTNDFYRNCSKYIKCVNGLIDTPNCFGSLHFDFITEVCINPSDAICFPVLQVDQSKLYTNICIIKRLFMNQGPIHPGLIRCSSKFSRVFFVILLFLFVAHISLVFRNGSKIRLKKYSGINLIKFTL